MHNGQVIGSTIPTRDLLGQLMGDHVDGSTGWSGPDTVRCVESIPPRAAVTADWPDWAPAPVVQAFGEVGIHRPWRHQIEAAEAVRAGHHVVIATGTASGKSLGYQLPALSALVEDPRATVLYLAPTKALATDQWHALQEFGLPGVRAATFDGDTPLDDRDWIREHSRFVLTNPDMLHRGILAGHARWHRFLRRLRYIVVDECHSYRGLFGSHVALVLRRLRRIAARYGSDPVVIAASATIADPGGSTGALIGSPVVVVDRDDSPSPGVDVVLAEPAVLNDGQPGEDGLPRRRSAPAEAAELLGRLCEGGSRTLAFIRSRHGAEQAAITARRWITENGVQNPAVVAAYRSGYLPEERRRLEADLRSGSLLGLATTNALELGIDITGLDAVVIAGFPGSMASLWQQAGRAGRDRNRALVVFVARPDPLDAYLVHQPQAVFGRAVEAAVLDPTNPRLLTGHLVCAATETHLTDDDLDLFGGAEAVRPVLDELVAARRLRHRPTGWYRGTDEDVHGQVDLRGSGGQQVLVVEETTGRLLGTVDTARAPSQVFPGAVHLHRGISYVVDHLDLESGVALVHPEQPEWSTIARSMSAVDLLPAVDPLRDLSTALSGGVSVGVGPVRVTEQVVGFVRSIGGRVVDTVPLEMPASELDTRACWYTLDPEVLLAAGVDEKAWPGALHAAEHAAIGLLPLFAGCDRSDIGGLSIACHPDTGLPTVIVHEGIAGGAGFTDRGYAVFGDWLSAVSAAISACPCRSGCPSCVHSPKCGNGNNPLDKAAAVVVLDLVVAALRSGPAVTR